MKPSFYNYVTNLSDGTNLFFNFYTLALIALDPSEAIRAQSILASPNQNVKGKQASGLKKLFVDKGFLIDERVNELELLKSFHYASRLQQNILNLTIAPTIACNFDCSYCYEDKRQETMSQEVEEAIVRFVKNGMVRNHELSVAWYGGEPLLCLDIIERLSKAFKSICQDRGAQYTASIVTNGYLLDGNTAKKLATWNVKDAQITIDGPPDIHEQRRPLKGGGKTFQKIIDNVKEASEQLEISLRMNVDDRNRDRILDLLDILSRERLQGKASLYLGHTYPYTDVCRDVAGWCLSEEDFSLLGLEIALETIGRGFGGVGVPASRNHWCMADSEYAYAITPAGGLVKCWNEVANPEGEVGHLLKPRTEAMKRNTERWRQRDPFELECAECLLLPICMGGCPYIFELTGRLECHTWKHHLKERVCFYYFIKKLKQESEIVQEFRELVEYAKETA